MVLGKGCLGWGGPAGTGLGCRDKGMGTRPAAPWRWQQRPQSLSPACPLPPPQGSVTPPGPAGGGRLGAERRVTSLGHQTPNGDPKSQLKGVGDGAPHSHLGAGFPVRVPTLQPEVASVPGGGHIEVTGRPSAPHFGGRTVNDATGMGVGWRGMAPPIQNTLPWGCNPKKSQSLAPFLGAGVQGGPWHVGTAPAPRCGAPRGCHTERGSPHSPPEGAGCPKKPPRR